MMHFPRAARVFIVVALLGLALRPSSAHGQSGGDVSPPAPSLVSGLVLPGGGHFRSGRPYEGAAVLVAAGSLLGWGLLSDHVHEVCAGPLEADRCPSATLVRTESSQPHRTAGILGAVGVTLLGALHAYFTAEPHAGTASPRQDLNVGLVEVTPGRFGADLVLARWSLR